MRLMMFAIRAKRGDFKTQEIMNSEDTVIGPSKSFFNFCGAYPQAIRSFRNDSLQDDRRVNVSEFSYKEFLI